MTNRARQMHAHSRALLLHRELLMQYQLAQAHKRAVAAIQPHLTAFLREYGAKLATLDEGEKLPLSWLYENGRLHKLEQVITAHIDAYAASAHAITAHGVTTAREMGREAAMAELHASVPVGVTWQFKTAQEGK